MVFEKAPVTGSKWLISLAAKLKLPTRRSLANSEQAAVEVEELLFDGTYVFVSLTKANETYVDGETGQIGQCPERDAGTLTIITVKHTRRFTEEGVGSHGKLAMLRLLPHVGAVSGAIKKDGTVRAPKTGR